MRVLQRFSNVRGHQTHQQTNGKRRSAIRPLRALWASFRSWFKAEDNDDVSLHTEAASTGCVSRDCPPFILAEIDDDCVSREVVMPGMFADFHPAPEGSAILISAAVQLPVRFAAGFDDVLDSFFSPPTRRVGFEDAVTVVPIASHRSLTVEEKGLLYRTKSTGTGKKKSTKERYFERSEHCFENAFEEDKFFPNHEGEWIHPAHLRKFVRKVLPELPRDMDVPGFSSFDEYYGVLEGFARQYRISLIEEEEEDDRSEHDEV